MRTAIGALALLVTVAFATGCDTTQPLQINTQTVDIAITAPSARVALYDTWVLFEDKNGNGISDDDYDGDGSVDEFLWCQPPFTGPVLTSAASAPWPFSIDVSVIRDGSTTLERVTSSSAISGAGNLASYDPAVTFGGVKSPVQITHPSGHCSGNAEIVCDPTNPASIACASNDAGSCEAGLCSGNSNITCDPLDPNPCMMGAAGTCLTSPDVTRTFLFTNARKLTAASFAVLSSVTNPLYELEPETSCPAAGGGVCVTDGPNVGGAPSPLIGFCDFKDTVPCDPAAYSVCPGVDFGPAQIDGGPSPLSLEIGNGDTVVVRARRLNSPPLGFEPVTFPGLSSTFLVDGQLVNVEGSTSQSANNPDDGINYSFTSR